MRPEVNSNRFEISLRSKISFRCKELHYQRSHDFGCSQFDRSEISNRSEFSM